MVSLFTIEELFEGIFFLTIMVWLYCDFHSVLLPRVVPYMGEGLPGNPYSVDTCSHAAVNEQVGSPPGR